MDSIYLHGSEEVATAARRMNDAASTMSSAASYIATTLEQHQRFMDDWLSRLEAALLNPEGKP
jgi:hypothetical protein